MNINATLFVQIGNFFVAYVLFHHIFLKPGYRALREKQRHQESLHEMVDHDKCIIEQERQKQKEAWLQFRGWCSDYCPPLVRKLFFVKGVTASLTASKLSEAQKKKVYAQLVDTMMTTIKERYEQ